LEASPKCTNVFIDVAHVDMYLLYTMYICKYFY